MIEGAIYLILALGVLGLIFALKPPILGEAATTIDDPWLAFRYFHRLALFGLCYMGSWVSMVIIAGSLPEALIQLFRQSPESTQALLMLALPIPLAAILYWGAATLSRRRSGTR